MARGFFLRLLMLLLSLSLMPAASADLFDRAQPGFVAVNKAFPFDFQQNNQQLTLKWQIKPGYYLYRHKLALTPQNARLAGWQSPPGKPHHDEFFGTSEIYAGTLTLPVQLMQVEPDATLSVTYQGCAAAGFCYPPETVSIPLSEISVSKSLPTDHAQGEVTRPFSPWWALLIGIGIAFTPCVLPMYPLISGIILGGRQQLSMARTLALALSYVQGMAITYTLLGLLVASAGTPLQAELQRPGLLIGLSVLFILLALAMFGAFNLQLPSWLQTRLTLLSQHQRGGSLIGVFVMGAIAGLICSPCTTAPLSAILLYIAQSADPLSGGLTLYLYALGMGLPLIAVTLFGRQLLPRSGPWMETIKQGFGFVILAVPLFLLERLIGELWGTRLWSLLAVSAAVWACLRTLNSSRRGSQWLALLWLVVAIAMAGPLQSWWLTAPTPGNLSHSSPTSLEFQPVDDWPSLETQLVNNGNRITMVDLYADWCVACKEFDKYTFSDPEVAQHLSQLQRLRANVTDNRPQDQQLLRKLKVLGLPTILFFNAQGAEIANSRISGFLDAKTFNAHLARVEKSSEVTLSTGKSTSR